MNKPTNDLVDNVLRSVCTATGNNLKMQQAWLQGWTRFWPGFSGRQTATAGVDRLFLQEWSNTMLDIARAQRDLMDQQFEAAMSTFDAAWGCGALRNGNGSTAVAEQPVVASGPNSGESGYAALSGDAIRQATPPLVPEQASEPTVTGKLYGNIHQKVAVVTGAGSGIGAAVARELAVRGAKAVLLVDRSDAVVDLAASINESTGRIVAEAKVGDTTDEGFRKRVFNDASEKYGLVTICVPAAGITRDALAVRVDKETGRAELYPIESFRQVTEVNLLAPIYWGLEMVARIAEDRQARGIKRWEPEEKIQGVVVFLGSVSSQGNKGQISYAVAKAGLEGATATLTKEAMYHGVRSAIIHPGFTDTPMAQSLGTDFLDENVLPYTQLRRLIRPEEIADAICFMISNSAVSGELWADAGWHPPA